MRGQFHHKDFHYSIRSSPRGRIPNKATDSLPLLQSLKQTINEMVFENQLSLWNEKLQITVSVSFNSVRWYVCQSYSELLSWSNYKYTLQISHYLCVSSTDAEKSIDVKYGNFRWILLKAFHLILPLRRFKPPHVLTETWFPRYIVNWIFLYTFTIAMLVL